MQRKGAAHCRPGTATATAAAARNAARIALILLLVAAMTPSATHGQECPSRCQSCQNEVADCKDQSLTAPPRDYPAGTRILDLRGNHIRILGSRTFHPLGSLVVLKLNKNKINSVRHYAFRCFANVTTIDLSENRIGRISPHALRGMTRLRTLTLNRNRIQSIANVFVGLSNLYQLNLAKNRIGSIGQNDLASLQHVSYIDLRNNRIAHIHPRAFVNMTRLRYLFVANNPLNRHMPDFHFSSQSLQLVDLSKCHLPSVPKTFPSSLSDYRLGYNRIMQVNFTDFSSITDLQLLALNDNELHFFADGCLAHLHELKEVLLRRNNLVYIPRDFPDSLERLHMDTNMVQEMEAGLFSSESRLNYLTMENNQIHRLHPDTFTGMRYLSTLNIQGNHIQVLETNSFKSISSLRTLLLSNNPLTRISQDAFHNLTSLSALYLSYISQNDFQIDYNFLPQMPNLSSLEVMASPALAEALVQMLDGLAPSEMVPLRNVTTLDLSYNTLEYISPKIRTLFPNLRSMPLDGNPLRCTRRLRWLRDWMRSTDSVSFSKGEEIICDSPPDLYGRPLTSLQDGEWGSQGTDRNGEMRDAGRVNRHAAMMARDMPDSGEVIRSSTHVESSDDSNTNSKDNNRGGGGASGVDERSSDQKSLSKKSRDTTRSTSKARKTPDMLKKRRQREERRRKRLRSRGGRKRRGRGRKGRKGCKGGKKKCKGKKGKRQKRDAGGDEETSNASSSGRDAELVSDETDRNLEISEEKVEVPKQETREEEGKKITLP